MRILLDTVTFLWIVSGAPDVPPAVREAVGTPDNEVFLSAVSAWEIAVKHALGRLPLPEPPDRFVSAQRERHRIEGLALEEEATLQLGRLPSLHRDPFDRMLVCQAIAHGLVLATPDRQIAQYPIRTLW